MCVIIINKDNKELDEEIIKKAERVNPDGFGIAYLDGNQEVFRTMDYDKARELLQAGRPYVAHYRYTTVGETQVSQCHPFPVRKSDDVWGQPKQSGGASAWLFMNGTVSNFGGGKKSDTCDIAQQLGDVGEDHWEFVLNFSDARFAVVKTDGSVIRTGKWHERDGILFSKDNVFPTAAGFNRYWLSETYLPSTTSAPKVTTTSAPKVTTTSAPKVTTDTTPPPSGFIPHPGKKNSIWSGPPKDLPGGGNTKLYRWGNFLECASGRGWRPPGKGWVWTRRVHCFDGGVWVKELKPPSSEEEHLAAEEEEHLVRQEDIQKICVRHGLLETGEEVTRLGADILSILEETHLMGGPEAVEDYLGFSGYYPTSEDPTDYETVGDDPTDDELRELGLDDGVHYRSGTVFPWEGNRTIAVYGTLRAGFNNHCLLKNQATRFITRGITKKRLSMVGTGVPFVLDDNDPEARQIKVEIYEVDDSPEGDRVLNYLDNLEGHPNLYERKRTKVFGYSGLEIDAWLYFSNTVVMPNERRYSDFAANETKLHVV